MAWTPADIPDQHGRLAVVTGANSGLGLEAGRALARAGATVVMGVRSLEKGERAADAIRADEPVARLRVERLDLGSLASVRAFAAAVAEAHLAVDILMNNAGVMAAPPRETVDGFESQVGTNHLGHFVLTANLMPALERAPRARVVTLTSVARLTGQPLDDLRTILHAGYDPWQAYGDSKLANYHFAIELARRLESASSSVESLVADPGLARTNLQVTTVEGAGAGLQGRLWKLGARWFGMSSARAVQAAVRAATDERASNGELYGPRWALFGPPVRRRVTARSARPDATERMWQVSETRTDTLFEVGGPR